jgi:hypothetical protein
VAQAKGVGASRSAAVTGHAELTYQLEHPSPEIIWARAVEVFGGVDLARKWMDTPLAILEDHTPAQHSGDRMKQREVLTVLARIEYGMFS